MTTAARHDSLETMLNPRILRLGPTLDEARETFASSLRRFAARSTTEGLVLRAEPLAPAAREALSALVDDERGVTLEPEDGAVLLGGPRSAVERILQRAVEQSDLTEIAVTLRDAVDRASHRPSELALRGGSLRFGARPLVMGIVNRTPDSFSDGGRYTDLDTAITHARELVDDGADILDVGGESTRPGAAAVDANEECERVVPLIRALASEIDVPISIDTTKSAVAERALEAGARIVNDVSGLADDPRLADVAAAHGAPLVLMHRRGTPRTMQNDPHYDDVMGDILRSLRGSIETAERRGLARERLIVDPGVGFGKTFEHNLEIFRGIDELRSLGLPILVGASRKAFLGKITGRDAADRDAATLATVAECAQRGIEIVRVHDVRRARDVVAVLESLHARRSAGATHR